MTDRREQLNPDVAPTVPNSQMSLTAEESTFLTQRIAELASGGFPLADGLRAAAAEPVPAAVGQAFRQFAERLDRGEPLVGILTDPHSGLPPHVGGLIVLAIRSGRLGEALSEWVEAEKSSRQLHRGLRESLAYPLWIGASSFLLILGIMLFIVPIFREMFDGFGLSLPFATRHLFWWHDYGLWLLLAAGAGAWGLSVLIRRKLRPADWSRWLVAAPLIGAVWAARGWAEWFGLMHVLVKHTAPLPDALRWSAAATSNAWIAGLSRDWAERAAAGERLSDIVANQPGFPGGAIPFLRWGESQAMLADSLSASREFLRQRARIRTDLVRLLVPPVVLILIGCCVLGIIDAMFVPLVTLINGLS